MNRRVVAFFAALVFVSVLSATSFAAPLVYRTEFTQFDFEQFTTTPGAVTTTTPGAIETVPLAGIVVNFNANGGELLPGNEQRTTTTGDAQGGTIGNTNMPIDPTRAGFTFLHWNTEQDGSGQVFTGNTMVHGNLTVYAQWGFEVRFNGNGILLVGYDPSNAAHFGPRVVVAGSSARETPYMVWPNDPVFVGHVFMGWYDTPAGTGGNRFDADTPINSLVVLFARWEINPIRTVIFNYADYADAALGNGHIATRYARLGASIRSSWDPPHNLNHGVPWALTAPMVTRPNMTVEGWWTQPGGPTGGGMRFAPPGGQHTPALTNSPSASVTWPSGHASTIVEEDMVVYPHWVYRVTFAVNGAGTNWGNIMPRHRDVPINAGNATINANGMIIIDAVSVVGQREEGMPPSPTRPGYTFVGWFDVSVATGGEEFTGDTPINSTRTVFARWAPNPLVTVTFEADGGVFAGGESTQTRNLPSGSTISSATGAFMPSFPTRDGHVFMGWYPEGMYPVPNVNNVRFSQSTVVNESRTVYARWMPYHTVTFEPNGGAMSSPYRVIAKGFSFANMSSIWQSTGGGANANWYALGHTASLWIFFSGLEYKSNRHRYSIYRYYNYGRYDCLRGMERYISLQ